MKQTQNNQSLAARRWQQLKLKRMVIALLNFASALALALTLFIETVKTDVALLINWLGRADLAERVSIYGHNSSFDEDYIGLADELNAIRDSSLYAKILVDSNLLVSVIIIVLVSAIIAGLAWLAWQNLKTLVRVYLKKNPHTPG